MTVNIPRLIKNTGLLAVAGHSFPTRRSSDLIGRASCRERVLTELTVVFPLFL